MAKPHDRMTEAELRQHQCGRKAWFLTRKLAKAHLRQVKQKSPEAIGQRNTIGVYRCPWSLPDMPHYHIGHRPTRPEEDTP